MIKTADVIVIGSGVIGCAAAYYMAKKGMSVLVLDQDESVGNGGSSRNGGGVRQSGRDPRELPLAIYGVENVWPTLSDELGVDVEYHKEGNLRLGKTETHKQILTGLTEKAVACGLNVRMIDAEEVRKINPYLSEEVTCASWCPIRMPEHWVWYSIWAKRLSSWRKYTENSVGSAQRPLFMKPIRF